jgi:hypothetical protein
VFPDYGFDQDENNRYGFGYHALLQDFISYFGGNNSKFTERQHRDFATFINVAVEAGGDLENAFDTCFLEHLIQCRARKPLSSFFSPAAKERLHA